MNCFEFELGTKTALLLPCFLSVLCICFFHLVVCSVVSGLIFSLCLWLSLFHVHNISNPPVYSSLPLSLCCRHDRRLAGAEADGVWGGDGHRPAQLCGHAGEERTHAVRVLPARRAVTIQIYTHIQIFTYTYS